MEYMLSYFDKLIEENDKDDSIRYTIFADDKIKSHDLETELKLEEEKVILALRNIYYSAKVLEIEIYLNKILKRLLILKDNIERNIIKLQQNYILLAEDETILIEIENYYSIYRAINNFLGVIVIEFSIQPSEISIGEIFNVIFDFANSDTLTEDRTELASKAFLDEKLDKDILDKYHIDDKHGFLMELLKTKAKYLIIENPNEYGYELILKWEILLDSYKERYIEDSFKNDKTSELNKIYHKKLFEFIQRQLVDNQSDDDRLEFLLFLFLELNLCQKEVIRFFKAIFFKRAKNKEPMALTIYFKELIKKIKLMSDEKKYQDFYVLKENTIESSEILLNIIKEFKIEEEKNLNQITNESEQFEQIHKIDKFQSNLKVEQLSILYDLLFEVGVFKKKRRKKAGSRVLSKTVITENKEDFLDDDNIYNCFTSWEKGDANANEVKGKIIEMLNILK